MEEAGGEKYRNEIIGTIREKDDQPGDALGQMLRKLEAIDVAELKPKKGIMRKEQ